MQSHQRKLANLWIYQRNRSPECLLNLSDRQLNLRQKESLCVGLNHHILPEKVRVDCFKASIEKLASSCQAKSGIPIEEYFKNQINFYFRKIFNDAKISCNNQKNRSLRIRS